MTITSLICVKTFLIEASYFVNKPVVTASNLLISIGCFLRLQEFRWSRACETFKCGSKGVTIVKATLESQCFKSMRLRSAFGHYLFTMIDSMFVQVVTKRQTQVMIEIA